MLEVHRDTVSKQDLLQARACRGIEELPVDRNDITGGVDRRQHIVGRWREGDIGKVDVDELQRVDVGRRGRLIADAVGTVAETVEIGIAAVAAVQAVIAKAAVERVVARRSRQIVIT
jgi:hypothetical protein